MPGQYDNREDALFAARIEDMFTLAEEKCLTRFSFFLDEHQQSLARQIAASHGGNYGFYGGFADSERTVLGIFPFYQEVEYTLYPVVAVTVTFRKEDTLSHRDFLGALMSLLIKRESIGDILVGEGIGVIFTFDTIAPIIIQELTKIGRVGVRCQMGPPQSLPVSHHFLDLSGTVSSMRLDCIVSFLTNLSREKSAQLIRSGLVQVGGMVWESVSDTVQPGSKISIRGYGKFLIEEQGALTKKGRIHLLCKKYI